MKSIGQKIFFIIFVLFMISIPFIFSDFFKGIELQSIDFKQYIYNQYHGKKFSFFANKVVILTADDLTPIELTNNPGTRGYQWPLSRRSWYRLIDFLESSSPKLLAITIPFEEYEDNSLSHVYSDHILSETLAKYNNIVLGTKLYSSNDFSQNAPMTSIMDEIDNDFKPVRESLKFLPTSKNLTGIPTYYSYSSIPNMFVNNASVGYLNIVKDSDSVVRYSEPVSKVAKGGNLYYVPSFPFAMFLKYVDYNGPINVKNNRLIINNYSIPLDKSARNLINWKNIADQYSFIPLSRLIIAMSNGDKYFEYNNIVYPMEFFEDKIVIITSMEANSGVYKSAVEEGLIPAEIYMNIFENYATDAKLDNPKRIKFIKDVDFNINIAIILAAGFLILANVVLFRCSILSFINSILFIILYIFADLFIFAHPKLRLNLMLVYPVYMMLLTLVASYIYVLMKKFNQKRSIVETFGKSVSRKVLHKLLKNSNKFELKTDKKKLTVMICDVVNFTSIIEQHSEDKVIERLNRLFKVVTSIILEYQGTIDKFVGDSVISYWGDPIVNLADSANAVKAGMAIVEAIDKLNKDISDKDIKLDVRVSINTGDAIVGCIGADKIVNYTVMGEAVNVVTRMEAICAHFNKRLLISESTYKEVDNFIQAEYAGNIKLKGKEDKVNLYSVTSGVLND